MARYDLLLFSNKIQIFVVPYTNDVMDNDDLAIVDWSAGRILVRKTEPDLMQMALWHELIHMGLYYMGHYTLWKKETLVQNLALLIKFLIDANPNVTHLFEEVDKICEK